MHFLPIMWFGGRLPDRRRYGNIPTRQHDSGCAVKRVQRISGWKMFVIAPSFLWWWPVWHQCRRFWPSTTPRRKRPSLGMHHTVSTICSLCWPNLPTAEMSRFQKKLRHAQTILEAYKSCLCGREHTLTSSACYDKGQHPADSQCKRNQQWNSIGLCCQSLG